MDDSTLHVELAVVRDGAKALDDCSDQMTGVLHSVARLHDDLLGVWTGPAAKVSETMWSDTETVVREHIEQLSGLAQSLQSASDNFEKQDSGNGEESRNV
ncbi:WXG100 family type VII secretion target [Mycolicibacterium sp.]|uniref:WXG100 family type VII secretion target n=1 Tax=Mycolicibacterium sp. TaxID=2320850 RepID=UPI0037CA15CC